jgi:hypothetical protein
VPPEVVKKLMDGLHIALADPAMSPSLVEKCVDDLFVESDDCKLVST